jgi:predicted transport protein
MFSEADRLEKATPTTRAMYHKFKASIMNIGDDISFNPTKKHIGVWAYGRRFANITVNIQSFKIWINVPTGTLRNDAGQTNITKIAHTINVNSASQLSQVLGWLKQAYEINRNRR